MIDQASPSSSDRLRTHPSERFEASARQFDLDEEFAKLAAESTGGHGHMQKTLYRRGGCTTAIFEFETGASLAEHSVEGEAIVHVLTGRITVHTPDGEFDLGAGAMLCIESGVAHDLVAKAPSRLMLHVILGAR